MPRSTRFRFKTWPSWFRGFSLLRLILITAAFLLAFRLIVLPFLGSYLLESTGPCQGDAVVVLAGDPSGLRLRTGIDLVRRNYAPYVLMGDTYVIYGQREIELASALAARQGLAPAQLRSFRNTAYSTQTEAVQIAAELRRLEVRRFILVTSDFHTHRAATIFRDLVPDRPFCVVPARTRNFRPDDWWTAREAIEVVVDEWIRTINTTIELAFR